MTCDARSAIQHQYNLCLQQHGFADSMRATNHELTTPRTEMLIGHWYLDEFGNLAREIKSREVPARARAEPRDRTKQMRTAAERLAQLTAF